VHSNICRYAAGYVGNMQRRGDPREAFRTVRKQRISIVATVLVPVAVWRPGTTGELIKRLTDGFSRIGEVESLTVHNAAGRTRQEHGTCSICGWEHDDGFARWITDHENALVLRGAAADIARLVHEAHERGLCGLSTKEERLARACGGYRHPCKAFDDLKLRAEYKRLFDTSRRGFISLRGLAGKNRNNPEYDRNDRSAPTAETPDDL
jgi:hypothetical protein